MKASYSTGSDVLPFSLTYLQHFSFIRDRLVDVRSITVDGYVQYFKRCYVKMKTIYMDARVFARSTTRLSKDLSSKCISKASHTTKAPVAKTENNWHRLFIPPTPSQNPLSMYEKQRLTEVTAVKERFSDSLRDVAKGAIKPVPKGDAMKVGDWSRVGKGVGESDKILSGSGYYYTRYSGYF